MFQTLSNLQKVENYCYAAWYKNSSYDGIEGKSVLDDLDIIQLEEVIETAHKLKLVFAKVEVHNEVQYGNRGDVADKPENLEDCLWL